METKHSTKAQNEIQRFKSYYVVWKLAWLGKHTARKQCLNRTMQYGNFLCRNKQVTKNKEFKSYYVVWKPGYAIFRYFEKRGLNRTMQYGNSVREPR